MSSPVKVCKNCGTRFADKYCNHCGQKAFEPADRNVARLFGEMFHFITHFEGSFWTSLKTVLLQPGKMSLDYCGGIRKKYFKPVSMFLFIVVLYLIFPGFSGLNVSLNEYRQSFLAGRLIRSQIDQKMASATVDKEIYAENFKHVSEKVSKFMLFLLVIVAAGLIRALFPRTKHHLYDDLILATEVNIFLILVFFTILPAALSFFLRPENNLTYSAWMEHSISLAILLLFALYTARLFYTVFKQRWWICLLKGTGFAALLSIFLIFIYRPMVFEVTYLFV
jgi:hypothetical protein